MCDTFPELYKRLSKGICILYRSSLPVLANPQFLTTSSLFTAQHLLRTEPIWCPDMSWPPKHMASPHPRFRCFFHVFFLAFGVWFFTFPARAKLPWTFPILRSQSRVSGERGQSTSFILSRGPTDKSSTFAQHVCQFWLAWRIQHEKTVSNCYRNTSVAKPLREPSLLANLGDVGSCPRALGPQLLSTC